MEGYPALHGPADSAAGVLVCSLAEGPALDWLVQFKNGARNHQSYLTVCSTVPAID
jgi:hypothetical protein